MTMRNFVHRGKPIVILTPADHTAETRSRVVSIRNYMGMFLHVVTSALGGAPVMTLAQAQNVAGSGWKDLNFTDYYTNLPTASPDEESDKWFEQDNSDSADLTLPTAGEQVVIPIRPGMLDVTNDFDCVGIQIDGTFAGTNIIAATLFLHDGPEGITDNLEHIPSARVNRMPTA